MGESPEHTAGTRHDREDQAHLEELPDGCGCAEVWEYLSGRRAEAREE